jgi:hypothetical protein
MLISDAKIGFTGIAVGAVALMLVLVQFWAGPFAPKPALEQTVAEKAVAIRDATLAALKGEEAPPPPPPPGKDLDELLQLAGAVLGGLAIIFAVVGAAMREPLRVAGGAAVLGGSAIAFQFAMLAIGAIVVAILVVGVLSELGFD